MPTYMCQGRYTRDAVKGMVASPEDRSEAVSKLVQDAGGRLIAFYVTFGEYDWMSIIEAPDEIAMSAAVIAGLADGGVTDMKTTVVMSPRDAMQAFRQAQGLAKSFKSAGQTS